MWKFITELRKQIQLVSRKAGKLHVQLGPPTGVQVSHRLTKSRQTPGSSNWQLMNASGY